MLWGLAVTWGTEVIRSPVENKDSSLDCSSGGRKETAENLQEEDHWGLTHAAGSQHHLLVRTQAASTLSSPPCSAGWSTWSVACQAFSTQGLQRQRCIFPEMYPCSSKEKFWLSLWVTTQNARCLLNPIQWEQIETCGPLGRSLSFSFSIWFGSTVTREHIRCPECLKLHQPRLWGHGEETYLKTKEVWAILSLWVFVFKHQPSEHPTTQ